MSESEFIICIFSYIVGYRMEAKSQYTAKDSLLEAKVARVEHKQ